MVEFDEDEKIMYELHGKVEYENIVRGVELKQIRGNKNETFSSMCSQIYRSLASHLYYNAISPLDFTIENTK